MLAFELYTNTFSFWEKKTALVLEMCALQYKEHFCVSSSQIGLGQEKSVVVLEGSLHGSLRKQGIHCCFLDLLRMWRYYRFFKSSINRLKIPCKYTLRNIVLKLLDQAGEALLILALKGLHLLRIHLYIHKPDSVTFWSIPLFLHCFLPLSQLVRKIRLA